MSSNTCMIVVMTVKERARHEDAVRRIEARVAAAAGALNVAHGQLVALAGELIETELWKGYGVKSVEHWLGWHAGLSPERARQITAVASRRAELPVTVATLVAGELSVDQVITVAKHAPAHNDAEVASFAKVATVTQLRSTLSRYSFAKPDADPTDPAGTETVIAADEAAAKGTVAMFHDGHRFGMKVDAPGDDGALIEQAMTEAKDALFQAGHPHVTWMDALLEVCNRSLTTVGSTSRRAKYRVYVHLDTDGAWLNQGPALPGSLLDKICCDTTIQPVWETQGVPVNVGRAQRIVPDRTRRLVLDRDRTCLVPGCGATHHLEIHHLIPWARGGRTDTANLGALCPFHHDALHRAELTITGNADDPTNLLFIDALGRVIPSFVPPAPPSTDTPADPTNTVAATGYQHPPGERMDNRWLHFSPPPPRASAPSRQPHAPPA